MKGLWQNNTPYSKLLISVGIILLMAVAFTLLSTGLAVAMYHLSMDEVQKVLSDYSDPRSIPILKLVQTISAIGTFILPPLVLAWLFSDQPKEYLGLDKGINKSGILAIVLMLAATPLINFLGEVNATLHLPAALASVEEWMRQTEDQAAEITKLFLKMDGPADLLLNLFMIGLIPAVGEELVFRGVVQRIFSDWWKNKHVAIWITAVLFSAMHMQFYGFLPRMVLGAMLGYLYVWSGSLLLPMLAHFTNNAGAVIFTYLFQQGYTSVDPDAIGTKSDVMSVVFSLAVTILVMFVIWRRNAVRAETQS